MNSYIALGTGIFVHENVRIGVNVTIGHGTCIGFGDPDDGEIIIEDGVSIGAFCVIHFGSIIKEGSCIHHRCIIGIEAEIGRNTQVLSGKEVTYKAKVGDNCIIGGNVADRTLIEDDVTFLGEIVHSHRNASLNWDETEEVSPIIKKGSFIGVNALLIDVKTIGPCSYVGSGEKLKYGLEESMAYIDGKKKLLTQLRGFIKSRCK